MTPVPPARPSSFRKYQPLVLRAWHWLDALAILGLLGTVLLRKTFLSWRTNAAFIQGELEQSGTPVSPEVAKAIAVGLRDRMWEWHYIFGFTLAGLLVVRALIAIFLPNERPGAAVARAVRAVAAATPGRKLDAAHFAAVKATYVLFYLSVLFMACTGLLMYFEASLGLAPTLVESMKELHELGLWLILVFAAGHVLGVVTAEHRGAAGLVSDMIQGGEKSPD
ncbi:MAG: cytochrome b/b6 domain-containing protein [Pseudomonadota bacterium]|nr:cytochrome b/b6 domain-containing protein [Pseudomonadota bacterium]